LPYQGYGWGTEMRAAILLFAFDYLGAQRAQSTAFEDNAASRAVSRTLGYWPDGIMVEARRGQPATVLRLVTTPERFRRPAWTLSVTGVDAVLPMLGV